MDKLKQAIKDAVVKVCLPPSKCHLPRPEVKEKRQEEGRKKQ